MKNPFAVLFVALILVSALTPLLSFQADGASVDVSGIVLDGEGDGIEGIEVTATPTSGSPVTATTDTEGKFTLNGLDDTRNYTITFPSGYGVSYCSLGETAGGYDLDLVSGASPVTAILYPLEGIVVKGTVFLDEDVDLTEMEINYRVQGETVWSPRVPVNANGTFEFPVSNGKIYEIMFKKDPFGIQGTSQNMTYADSVCVLDLTGNKANEVVIAVMMTPVYGTLTGSVISEDGVNLSEVHVELSSGGTVIANTTTRNGIYTFERIPIGPYSVTITRSDLEPQTKDVTVDKDGSVLDFTANTKIPTYILGLDFPHSLMFAGAILGIIVIGVIGAYRVHIGRKARKGDSDEVYELDDDRDLKDL